MNDLDEFVGTTAVEELALSQYERATQEFRCKAQGCEAVCKPTDEGVNVFMSYCNACNIKLHAELNDMVNSDEEVPSEDPFPPSDEAPPADDSAFGTDHDPSPAVLPTDGRGMNMDDITSSLISLVRAKDGRQVASLNFGKSNALPLKNKCF